MTITEMCAVMLAHENGAKIEFRWIDSETWYPALPPGWNWTAFEYRVAEFPQEQDDEKF